MNRNRFDHLMLIAVTAFPCMLGTAWAATGKISAFPNPCKIDPGAHQCTAYLAWSTEGAVHARVFVQAQGKNNTGEREFGAENACEKCGATWIEEGDRYVFTLVDFSNGRRGAILSTVTVTAVKGPPLGPGAVSGTITASPNPCRIEHGKVECTTYLTWSSTGTHARVYVSSEGAKGTPEREFATGRAHEKVSATWIEEKTRYTFTLVDFSEGSRGRDLTSVVVTATE